MVCDINNLKAVNDLYGHKEGDTCIRNACAKICGIFSHSPVFRIGGDEFAVLLSGDDYDDRKNLMEQINDIPTDRAKVRIGETVSAGMAEYEKNRHYSLLSVFEEADKAMYEKKQFIKEKYFSGEYMPDSNPVAVEIPVFNVRKCILIAMSVLVTNIFGSFKLPDNFS